MRRLSYKPYLIFGAALFLLISLPTFFVENIRGTTMGMLSSIFRGASHIKQGKKGRVDEANRLESENHLLRIEIGKLRALLEQQAKMSAFQKEGQRYSSSQIRYEEMNYLMSMGVQAIPARVIYRDPGNWSSSLWVNVGEETNKVLNRPIIQKNSPVIVGRSVVGAVDYVGKKQSRIRLITDVALKPSVRAVRGFPQNSALVEHIDPLLRHLNGRTDLPLSAKQHELLAASLSELREKCSEGIEEWYLAKGILQGAGSSLWRGINPTLRGVGFNYDFSDAEGPARELTTGKPIGNSEGKSPPLPIIQVNDLLVTTGMDGVFPPGLRVAEVTKIFPLREGAYSYEIEATPVVGNLDTLQTVFIIFPLGYENEEWDL